MTAPALAPLTLGYRLLWNRQRRLAGVELLIDEAPPSGTSTEATLLDARAVLAALDVLWPSQAPQLILSLRSKALLLQLLTHYASERPGGRFWLRPSPEQVGDPVLGARLRQAVQRGLSLPPGPVVGDPQTLRQAAQALDVQSAWAVAAWPAGDALKQHATAARRPARVAIERVLEAIDKDASDDTLEALVNDDPVLCLRFLRQVNLVAPRERGEIDTVARGLRVWGLKYIQDWLTEQLEGADTQIDMHPVRAGIVLHAHLVEHLLDPGEEEDLRREIYLCGLLAQMERLLDEPLEKIVHGLPLSQRILQALLNYSGPYHPALQLADACEAGDARAVGLLCESYGYTREDVNLAVLKALAGAAQL